MQYLLNYKNRCLHIANIWPSQLYFHLSYCTTTRRKSQMGEKRGPGVVWGHVNICVHQGAVTSCTNYWQLITHHITCTCKFITSAPWSFIWLAPTCLTSLLKIEALFLQNTGNLLPKYTVPQHRRAQQEYQLSYTNFHAHLSLRYLRF
jgi:hypothetical protein